MKRAFSLLELLIVVAIIAILAVFLWPVTSSHNGNTPRSDCQSNLKQIGLGFLQYAQDAGEKFPPARITATSGWADVLQPYIKSRQLFQCRSTSTSTPLLTDYFYNRNLARISQMNIDSAAQTILSGDGADNAPTWNSIPQLPLTWMATPNSPSLRHLETANYLFADGHVKSLKPPSIKSTLSNEGSNPTFAVQYTS